MNRNRRKAVTGLAAVSMSIILAAAPTIQAAAADTGKEENVYANLEEDGSVRGIYVVNSYDLDSDTEIVDYGDYSSVKNLSSDEKINVSGDKITVAAEKGKFYYQGNLTTKDLPWNITLHYYLDGKEVEASDLAGASGRLKITIGVSENSSVDSDFYDNYLLQAKVVLDTDKCSDITADGATVGNEGSDKDLVYNFFGSDSKEVEIDADVKDFEMDSITFTGVPLSLSIDKDDLDLSDLYDKADSISSASEKLSDGADKLSSSVEKYTDGVSSAADGSAKLESGLSGLDSGISRLSSGASDLYSGTKKYTDSVSTYTKSVDSYVSGVEQIYTSVSQSAEKLKALSQSDDPQTAAAARAQYQSLESLLSSLKKLTANDSALTSAGDSLDSASGSLLSGASEVKSGAGSVSDGISEVKSGAGSLTDGLNTLDKSGSELDSGAESLASGAEKFSSKTSGLSDKVDEKTDELISKLSGSDYKPESFVSTENTDVSRVQFVMKTDAVEKPETKEKTTTEKKETLLDRIK
ncbi:MAG: hypothetical protein ACI4CS_01835, partial [Candidatus Weimeria sp.]